MVTECIFDGFVGNYILYYIMGIFTVPVIYLVYLIVRDTINGWITSVVDKRIWELNPPIKRN
jgi:hypothetical protein